MTDRPEVDVLVRAHWARFYEPHRSDPILLDALYGCRCGWEVKDIETEAVEQFTRHVIEATLASPQLAADLKLAAAVRRLPDESWDIVRERVPPDGAPPIAVFVWSRDGNGKDAKGRGGTITAAIAAALEGEK